MRGSVGGSLFLAVSVYSEDEADGQNRNAMTVGSRVNIEIRKDESTSKMVQRIIKEF
jgi:hypothetical protein